MLAFHPIVFKVDFRSRKLDLIKQLAFVALALTILSPMLAYGEAGSAIVDVDGTEFTVNYDAERLTLNGIQADTDFISLLIDIEVTEATGILEITLVRSFFDATFAGTDDDYIVIADGGDEPDFEEIETTSESRTLRIELPSGTDEVEIIGTVFGTGDAPEPAAPEPEPESTPEPTPAPAPTPKPETTTECGEGTVLKDGLCVLDERCGEGTVMKDGVCVLVESSSPSMSKGGTFDLVYGAIAGFIIAFIAAIILWIMSRGARRKD